MNFKNKHYYSSVKCALSGFIASWKSERNLKIYLMQIIVFTALNFCFKFSFQQHITSFVIVAGAFSSECFNAAIEQICDLISTEYNKKIKKIKDISASALLYWGVAYYIFELVSIGGKLFGK